MRCAHCNRENEGNPSDYYHRKQCHARYLEKRIKLEGPKARLWGDHGPTLEDELEKTRYVGD